MRFLRVTVSAARVEPQHPPDPGKRLRHRSASARASNGFGVFPDVAQVAPTTTKVLFENDKIRVLEESFRKGQKVAMHSHPPHFAYALTRIKFKSTLPDSKTAIVKMKKGEGSSSKEAGSHAVESYLAGAILVVELK